MAGWARTADCHGMLLRGSAEPFPLFGEAFWPRGVLVAVKSEAANVPAKLCTSVYLPIKLR